MIVYCTNPAFTPSITLTLDRSDETGRAGGGGRRLAGALEWVKMRQSKSVLIFNQLVHFQKQPSDLAGELLEICFGDLHFGKLYTFDKLFDEEKAAEVRIVRCW